MPHLNGKTKRVRNIRLTGGVAICSALLVILAACSGPSGIGEDATPTNTAVEAPTDEPAPTEEPAPTATTPPTETPQPPTATAESTATETTAPTATATSVPPSPTATEPALPTDGAELSVVGKSVERIIPAGEDGEVLYAVTDSGLSRSNDGGANWSAAGDVQPGTIIASRGNPDVLYAGDRAACGRGFTEVDFRRSEDGGESWSIIEASHGYEPLLADETGDGPILYGTECGLSVSTDRGESWTDVPEPRGESIFDVEGTGEPLLVTSATEGGSGRLFALTGSDPAALTAEGPLTGYWGAGYIDRQDDRIALATASGVGVSDDGGQTWSWSRDGLEETTYSVDPREELIPDEELDAGYQLTDIAINPANPDRIWVAGSHGAFRSDDGGQTWQRIGGAAEIDSLVLSPFAERVFVSADGSTRVWSLDGSND